MRLPLHAVILCLAGVLVGHEASAGDTSISLGEVASPPPSFGVDAAALHAAAESAIRQLHRPHHAPRVVVSVALTRAELNPVNCTVNATVRDARTGKMLVVVEAVARSSGPVTSSDVRKQVANAAVQSAIERIPGALAAK